MAEEGGGTSRIGMHRFLVDQIFYAKVGNFGAPAANGSEREEQQRPIAKIDQTIAGASGHPNSQIDELLP